MIRKYNYTGRKKVLAKKIKIIESTSHGSKSFNASIDVKDMGFPDDAKIFIEPYFKSSFMRFDFGTVARPIIPTTTSLNDLPTTDYVRYRVKIVDGSLKHGMILGFADIQGSVSNEGLSGRQAILPVDFTDLGKRIWTLEFRPSGPVLAVNESIDNIREKVKSDDVFFSLVYPEIIKRIAKEIIDEDYDPDYLTGWKSDWMKFFEDILMQPSVSNADDDEAIEHWANDLSDTFARKYKVIERYK